MFTLSSIMLPVVQDRKDKDMAQPASSILKSDVASLLQLTCITSQEERDSTRQATAPSADIRNIHITQSCSKCYIGYRGEAYEPASDNAYFASKALEYNHALITLNDKGVHYIQDTSILGGMSVNGMMLQKRTPITLPASSEIIFMRIWEPVTSIWTQKITLRATVWSPSSALSSMENSSTPRVHKQSPLNDHTDTESNSAREDPLIPRGARKRPHSQIKPDDDSPLPSRRDKSLRSTSSPDIRRWQESVSLGTRPDTRPRYSQQDHSTIPSQGSLPGSFLTRSRSESAASSNGPPTLPPPGDSPRHMDFLSDRAKTELLVHLFACVKFRGPVPHGFQEMAWPYAMAVLRLPSSLPTSDIERS